MYNFTFSIAEEIINIPFKQGAHGPLSYLKFSKGYLYLREGTRRG